MSETFYYFKTKYIPSMSQQTQGQTLARKKSGEKNVHITKFAKPSICHCLTHPTSWKQLLLACYNQESQLRFCQHPSHPCLKGEDAL